MSSKAIPGQPARLNSRSNEPVIMASICHKGFDHVGLKAFWAHPGHAIRRFQHGIYPFINNNLLQICAERKSYTMVASTLPFYGITGLSGTAHGSQRASSPKRSCSLQCQLILLRSRQRRFVDADRQAMAIWC